MTALAGVIVQATGRPDRMLPNASVTLMDKGVGNVAPGTPVWLLPGLMAGAMGSPGVTVRVIFGKIIAAPTSTVSRMVPTGPEAIRLHEA